MSWIMAFPFASDMIAWVAVGNDTGIGMSGIPDMSMWQPVLPDGGSEKHPICWLKGTLVSLKKMQHKHMV